MELSETNALDRGMVQIFRAPFTKHQMGHCSRRGIWENGQLEGNLKPTTICLAGGEVLLLFISVVTHVVDSQQ